MKQLDNPNMQEWSMLCQRPSIAKAELSELVSGVFEQVKQGGDDALLALTEKYDGRMPASIKVPIRSEEAEAKLLQGELRAAIDTAYRNIWTFHKAQQDGAAVRVETQPGVTCWRETRPIERVGLYVPGGTAPLISTMLMLGVPAQLAGCQEVVVCTPLGKDGAIAPGIRYAAAKCGIRQLFAVGGAQAIAAMTLGTETVPKVSKLFGPGNQYVTAAKKMALEYGVAIDMPAGPSEVLVIADESARPDFVAADLLSQAEHGTDSQVILVTNSKLIQTQVEDELAKQLQLLPRKDIAEQALQNSLSVYFDNLGDAFEFTNEYASEHVIVQTQDAEKQIANIRNAGSVFLGYYTPESAGDYASGTNHTLPTGGWAKSYSGLSVQDFQQQVTFQSITKNGLAALRGSIVPLAEAEGLSAHARAVSIRLQ